MSIWQRLFGKSEYVPPSSYISPDRDWIKEQNSKIEFTPDLLDISQKDMCLLFVYDEMMRRHPMHSLINEHCAFLATAFTNKPYCMWKRDNHQAVLLQDGYLPTTTVKGELYGVYSYQFPTLDSYKKNGIEFVRRRVSLNVPHRIVKWTMQEGTVVTEEKDQAIKAWAYIGVSEYWKPKIDAGFHFNPVRKFSAKRDLDYYYYSLMEYNAK